LSGLNRADTFRPVIQNTAISINNQGGRRHGRHEIV
jgi:hypothetical protein